MERLPKIRQMQLFMQIVRSGSIRAAGRDLGMSQPGVSRTIRELEQLIGAQLFLRDSDGVILTEAGKAFSLRVEWILSELTRATSEVEQINNYSHGVMNIGSSTLLMMTALPDMTSSFLDVFPYINLNIKEGQLSTLLPLVRNGELDLAVGSVEPTANLDDVSIEPLLTASFSIVCRKGHPLEQARSLAELQDAKWLLPELNIGYYHSLQEEFREFYSTLNKKMIRTDSLICALNMVLYSDYLTIIARATEDSLYLGKYLSVVPVSHLLPSANYYILWSGRSALTMPAQRFIQILKDKTSKRAW